MNGGGEKILSAADALPTIMAWDLASCSGWAEGAAGNVPFFGSLRFAPVGAPQEEVFAGCIKALGNRLQAFRPDVLAYEEPSLFQLQRGKTTLATVEMLFGLPAVVQGVAYRFGVRRIMKVQPAAVRRHFIGTNPKREIAKKTTVSRCRELGIAVKNDDEADAVAIHSFMSAYLVPELRSTG